SVIIIIGFILFIAPKHTPIRTQKTSETDTPDENRRHTLKILMWNPPVSFIPTSTGVKDTVAQRIFYEPLAAFDEKGELIPVLAAEIPSIENGGLSGDAVTWKLKKNVTWSDGEPFTAKDVDFTHRFHLNPAIGSAQGLPHKNIKHLEIIDQHTVRLYFKSVTPFWADAFVGADQCILPQHILEPYNGPSHKELHTNVLPVGTGPYRVIPPGIEFLAGSEDKEEKKTRIILERNPYYRGKKPFFKNVEIRGGISPLEAARLSIGLGKADFAWNLTVSKDILEELRRTGVGKAAAAFTTTIELIDLNQTDPAKGSELAHPHPILTDLRVRQAIAHSIDRKAIARFYGETSGIPANRAVTTIAPPGRENLTYYPFDLKKAAALLEAAGWSDSDGDGIRDKEGRKLELTFQGSRTTVIQQTQRLIQKNLKSVGMDINLRATDTSVYYSGNLDDPRNSTRFSADMQEANWSAYSADPSVFLSFWTCKDNIPQKNNNWKGWNDRRWCSPEYDRLYQKVIRELDQQKRHDLLVKMNDMIAEEAISIPIIRLARIQGLAPDIEGFAANPWDVATWNISEWRRTGGK
ncbi:peptide ABC transporter substrate-binding protein, partial [Desulfococcaceae bacterium HSG8]|nr:peptide ABC transporter substrate-binding protein [Desulfococcaceae bacterium HSG8]